MFQGSLSEESSKGVQVRWKDISSIFKGGLKGIRKRFNRCAREVSLVFQGRFKGVSRKFQGSLKSVSRKFQGYFEKISRVFQG